MSSTSLVAALGPSIISGSALIAGGVLAYIFTSKHEHRKWLRQERLESYVGYIAALSSMGGPQRHHGFSQEEVDRAGDHASRVALIGSPGMVALAEKHRDQLLVLSQLGDDESEEMATRMIREVRRQARKDLKPGRRWWSFMAGSGREERSKP